MQNNAASPSPSPSPWPEPFTAWPWRRPAGRAPRSPEQPAIDVELATLEREVGLTAAVARRIAELAPSLLGPLLHDPAVRPLSLEGGRLCAVAIERVPQAADWQAWLADVEHVQTNDPAVAAALADGRRSFLTSRAECARVARAATPPELVQELPTPIVVGEGPPWVAAPNLDAGFVPLVQLAFEVWLCWDRDYGRPAVVIEGSGRPHFFGRGSDRMSVAFGPVGPLPYAGYAPPSAPESHLAAAGTSWAAAVSRHGSRQPPQLATAPGNRWVVLSPFHVDVAHWGDGFAWSWRHHPERSVADVPKGYRWSGSVMSVEIVEQRTARIRWAGDTRAFRLRDGALTPVTEPHTLARQLAKEGRSAEEIAAMNIPNIVVGGLGYEEEIIELPLAPGDRLLVCSHKTLDAVDADTLKRLLAGDLRRGANELQLLLEAARVEDVALFLCPASTTDVPMSTPTDVPAPTSDVAASTSDVARAGWLTPLALSLVEEEARPPLTFYDDVDTPKPDPHEQPQRWSLYRAQAARTPVSDPVSPRWIEALRGALGTFAFAPRAGDVFRVLTARERALQLQFDGTSWQQIDAVKPSSDRAAAGRLVFREDAPSPRLAAILERAAREPVAGVEVESIAREDGFAELALWLHLTRAHRHGEPIAGLELAREQTSARVREALMDVPEKGATVPHDIEAATLFKSPHHFHRCVVRYRSHVSEGAEQMRTAGAWWEPAGDDGPLRYRRYFSEVEARWFCDPRRGYGHFHASHALARGRATPVPIPESPRRITEDQLRRRDLRRGVPLRVELTVRVEDYKWTWEGIWLARPPGVESMEPCSLKIDAIIAMVEGLVILAVLSSAAA